MRTRLLACTVVALAAVACSGDDESAGDDPFEETTTTGAPSGGTETVTFELASAEAAPLQVEVPDDPVASAPAARTGAFLDVFLLERDGDTVTLVFRLRNESADGTVIDNPREFSDDVSTGYNPDVRGVSLVDTTNLRRHLVLLDSAESCVCSNISTYTRPEHGQSVVMAAVFAAPPPDVERMTVQTPLGAVPDVPLTDDA